MFPLGIFYGPLVPRLSGDHCLGEYALGVESTELEMATKTT